MRTTISGYFSCMNILAPLVIYVKNTKVASIILEIGCCKHVSKLLFYQRKRKTSERMLLVFSAVLRVADIGFLEPTHQ